MALLDISCDHCKRRVTPSMSLQEVKGEIWCNICIDERREGNKNEEVISGNPCTDVEITFMNQCLKDAGWKLQLKPTDNGRDTTFNPNSYLWWNKASQTRDWRIIETFVEGIWKYWSYETAKWQMEIHDSFEAWQCNWDLINAEWGPNSVKKP